MSARTISTSANNLGKSAIIGAVVMASVQEEYATAILDFSGKIVAVVNVQILNIGMKVQLHVLINVHPVLTKINIPIPVNTVKDVMNAETNLKSVQDVFHLPRILYTIINLNQNVYLNVHQIPLELVMIVKTVIQLHPKIVRLVV